MMWPSSKTDEHGAIFFLTIFMVIVVLAVGALALDSANLYRSRLYIQKAADAAVMSGLRKRAETGYPKTTLNPPHFIIQEQKLTTEIEDAAFDAAHTNLSLNGLTAVRTNTPDICNDGKVCINTKYLDNTGDPSSDDTVKAEFVYPVKLLLMHLIPFDLINGGRFGRTSTVRVTASSRPQKINVSLLLDTSASMRCPSQTSDCSCRTAPGGCSGLRLKIDDLRDSVTTFISRYNPNKDRVGIINFNTLATTVLTMRITPPGYSQSDAQSALALLNDAGSTGATNICDAFSLDYHNRKDIADALKLQNIFETTLDADREINETILFSDGAPTAGRFCFAPNAAQCQNNRNEDLCLFSVRWGLNSESVSPPLHCETINGRPFGFSQMRTPLGSVDPLTQLPGARPPCSILNSSTAQSAGDVNLLLGGCVPDLSFVLPSEPNPYSPVALTAWQDQFAHCPIVWSDLLRKHKVSVEAIGLGMPPNTFGSLPPTTVIVPGEEDFRQDHLLVRMTGDMSWRAGAPRTKWPPNYPQFQYRSPGTASIFSELDDSSLPQELWKYRGAYYATTDPTQLPEMFRLLSLRIGSKLTR